MPLHACKTRIKEASEEGRGGDVKHATSSHLQEPCLAACCLLPFLFLFDCKYTHTLLLHSLVLGPVLVSRSPYFCAGCACTPRSFSILLPSRSITVSFVSEWYFAPSILSKNRSTHTTIGEKGSVHVSAATASFF